MRRSHVCLVAILLLHFLCAVVSEAWFWNYAPDGGPGGEWMKAPVIYWLPLGVLIFLWLKADMQERHLKRPVWESVIMPLLFPVGIPYYYMRTYQLRLAALHIGAALLFATACLATIWLGQKLTYNYYALWTNK